MAESQVNASTADTDAAESAEAKQGGLERKMETRHLTMISLGGVIGTGLFLSSGYTIHQAGPLGAIIAYGIGSMLVYFVMLSLANCRWPCRMRAAFTCMRSVSSAPAPRSPSPCCIG